MSFKGWLSIITFLLIVVIIFFSRHKIMQAWELLGQVNLWILFLIIPTQLLAYYAVGEMLFTYLRDKKELSQTSRWSLARLALEAHFVNHVLPSGGVSGFSYVGWRLNKMGVSASRSTLALVVRYALGFLSFITLLVIAVIIVTWDSGVSRQILMFTTLLTALMVFIIVFGIYIVNSKTRLNSFARWFTKASNRFVAWISAGRKKEVLKLGIVENFFDEIYVDYVALKADKKLLLKPYLWGLAFIALDVLPYLLVFWSLGSLVNPAPVIIAYGLASFAGFIVITPGGAGAFEALMIGFLAAAGLGQGLAIAGVLLCRVILLLLTVGTGYIFYQLTIWQQGNDNGTAKR